MLSKDEAAQALNEIDDVKNRTLAMQGYRLASPYFVLWGCIWLIANCITDVRPLIGGLTWQVLTIVGIAGSVCLSMRTIKRQSTSPETRRIAVRRSWQFAITSLAILGYFVANFSLLPHLSLEQGNAYVSLFWAFLYVLMGIWTGWRILTVGVAAAIAILVGYFALTTHYFLWMGLVTGSLLILGGFWLRKV
jgi:hypothetical protein